MADELHEFRWVGDWSGRRARLSPEKTGLVDATTGNEYSYADLEARANRSARMLRSMGVEQGDRVAVLSRNRPEFVDLFFATAKIAAILAPLSYRLVGRELAALLSDVDPALLVFESELADLAHSVLTHEDCDVAPSVLVVESDEAASESAAELPSESKRWADQLSSDDSPVEHPDVSMADPHLFLHTGGSTGLPKETIVPHRSVYWNSINTITAWGLEPRDLTPMTFPMFHTGGWNVLTVPLFHVGGTVVIAREFDPSEVLSLVETRKASVLVAVPAVLRAMTTHDDWAETTLSSLRFVKSGGGPCRQSVMETWWDRNVELSQGYGLTECGPNNFAMPTDWPREKASSVGVPVPHVDVRIVDDTGEELSKAEIGELELAGPHAADGYWNAPEATEATFGGGWVSTGDLAQIDAEGYIHIEGRKKNMFTSGGENVYPPEVEDAIADHPDVADVVVIGVPDEQWGTVGKAVVELGAASETLTLEALREFLDDRLARFKQPREFVTVNSLPMAGPSKIDRGAVEAEWSDPDE